MKLINIIIPKWIGKTKKVVLPFTMEIENDRAPRIKQKLLLTAMLLTGDTNVSGKLLRLGRLVKNSNSSTIIIPLDHTVTTGPFKNNSEYEAMLHAIADGGADGIVVHKGRARFIPAAIYKKMSVLIHVSASTIYSPDQTHKCSVAAVEECIFLGADGISVHVNLGAETEFEQLSELGKFAETCSRFGLPLLAMMYPRGPGAERQDRLKTLAHAGSLAADLGADLVKLPLSGGVDAMSEIVSCCPIPVLAAGGNVTTEAEFDVFVTQVMASGAAGLAAGRNVFMAENPSTRIRHLRQIAEAHSGHSLNARSPAHLLLSA